MNSFDLRHHQKVQQKDYQKDEWYENSTKLDYLGLFFMCYVFYIIDRNFYSI